MTGTLDSREGSAELVVDYERDPNTGEVFTVQKLVQSETPQRLFCKRGEEHGYIDTATMEFHATPVTQIEAIRKALEATTSKGMRLGNCVVFLSSDWEALVDAINGK